MIHLSMEDVLITSKRICQEFYEEKGIVEKTIADLLRSIEKQSCDLRDMCKKAKDYDNIQGSHKG